MEIIIIRSYYTAGTNGRLYINAAQLALPALLLKIAGYLAVAGTGAATVTQTVTAENENPPVANGPDGQH